jgi:hypothetical protein
MRSGSLIRDLAAYVLALVVRLRISLAGADSLELLQSVDCTNSGGAGLSGIEERRVTGG